MSTQTVFNFPHAICRSVEVVSRYAARLLPFIIWDKLYCQAKYYRIFNEYTTFAHPLTFNQKIQWLKLYYRKAEFTNLADKYAVRNFVLRKVGNHILNDLIGVYSNVDEINFEGLPSKFALKATHGCGWNILCKDKSRLDVGRTKAQLRNWLGKNFYDIKGEWVYRNIPPKIICEAYLEGEKQHGLMDYKIFCFDGQPIYIQVDLDRYTNHKRVFYDLNWVKQPFTWFYPAYEAELPRPSKFDLMIDSAKRLAREIPFCRVDFYDLDTRVVFGEITFYPESGFKHFSPEEYDRKLGDLLVLPPKNGLS